MSDSTTVSEPDPSTLVCQAPPPVSVDPHDDWVHQVCGTNPQSYVQPAPQEAAPPSPAPAAEPAPQDAAGAGGASGAGPAADDYKGGAEGGSGQPAVVPGPPITAHELLDIAGFVPGIGPAANLVNAGLYMAEGDERDAAINAGAAAMGIIPFGKLGAKAAYWLAGRAMPATAEVLEAGAKAIAESEFTAAAAVIRGQVAKGGAAMAALQSEVTRLVGVVPFRKTSLNAAEESLSTLRSLATSSAGNPKVADAARMLRQRLQNLASSEVEEDVGKALAGVQAAKQQNSALLGEVEAELARGSPEASLKADAAAVNRTAEWLRTADASLRSAQHDLEALQGRTDAMLTRLRDVFADLDIPW